MANRVLSGRTLVLTVLVLLVVAGGAHQVRRAFIRSFFGDGPPGAAPAFEFHGGEGKSLERASRVRVVILDGLRADVADELPAVQELCREGLSLTVDVGFPTVSLPVQHVLWTGQTQQQSGILYRIPKLDTPPPGSVPAQVESLAVAESHPDIVGSFGFSEVVTDEDDFLSHATAAVSGPQPLVLVHVLRIDDAGHRHGADSDEYRDAAKTADEILGKLRDADSGARWFVLADHGHREGGGHAGPEPELRLVRGCIAGDLPSHWREAPGDRAVHLVDFSQALMDSLGLPPRGAGRPLGVALLHPEPNATMPSPPWFRAALGLLLLLLTIVGVSYAGRVPPPVWLPLAYLGVVVFCGWPTLSNPVVYPPHGLGMLKAASPAAVVLGLSVWRGRQRFVSTVLAQLLPGGALAIVCLVLSGAGPRGGPPLMPVWTAHASVLLTFTYGAALVAVLVTLIFGTARTPD